MKHFYKGFLMTLIGISCTLLVVQYIRVSIETNNIFLDRVIFVILISIFGGAVEWFIHQR
jgi:hypothetical protein